jgi:hypothetical protein
MSDATGTINVSQEYVYPGQTYTTQVVIGSRLPNMNSTISWEITEYQQDAAGYAEGTITGGTFTGNNMYSFIYFGAGFITPTSAGTNIYINIPVDNDT